MMRTVILFLAMLIVTGLSAQDFSGYWEGKIAVSKKDSLTIGLQVERRADTLYAELDSPDQYFTGQPVTGLEIVEGTTLRFRVPEFGLSYTGSLTENGHVKGTCTQYGRKFACTLAKGTVRKQFLRPQTPEPPYPYRTEEVHFCDRSGKKPLINGTLTLPSEKPKGLVILISGSGWQDRDETLFAHKPFAVLADTLTRAGFATYRYDDFPTPIFRNSTTFDFADGVRLILDSIMQIKELQGVKVGLLGHSEGSLVASIVAANDKRVAFTIHLAGVAQPFDEILLYQSEAINRASNNLTEKEIENSTAINRQMYALIKKCKSKEECAEKIGKMWDELSAQLTEEEREKYNMTPEGKFTAIQTMTSPWYFTLFRINPSQYLKKIKTPVLAISGEKDLQVLASATLSNMQKTLKNNKLNHFESFPGLNHLLQPCSTGNPDEYGTIETTIAPEVLGLVVRWTTERVSNPKTAHLYGPDDDGTVYTSLDAARLSGKPVYRLKLTRLADHDSLPEELFELTDLRELTVKGCRLNRLNQNIGKLTNLQYLNLDHNKILRLPETIGNLANLRTLIISRNIIEELPERIGDLHQLTLIDAWGNPLYVLPESITRISKTLKTLDLRQIPLNRKEYDAMEALLPETDILFTDICECENRRDHD